MLLTQLTSYVFVSDREMAEAEVTDKSIECGYCFSKDGEMKDAKILPCSHVHCLGCLSQYYELNEMVYCPLKNCKYVLQVNVSNDVPVIIICIELIVL